MNSKLRDILNGIADIGRGWVHDQLDGTRFIKDALDGIDKEVAEAEKAIRQAVAEEVLGIIGEDEPELVSNTHKNGGIVRNQLRAELRQKIKQWQEGWKNVS